MDRGGRREDILRIGAAKGAESALHRLCRGQHQHKPARADELCAQLEFQSTVDPLQRARRARPFTESLGSDQEPKAALRVLASGTPQSRGARKLVSAQ
jgi:hypothetical protein